jgi:hypothetical protein
MQKQVVAIMVVAALGLTVICTVSPNATVIANEASTEIYGIDVLGLTRNAKDMPVEQYAAI